MITDQERMKTDVVFVDTIIRECALMAIQCEQYRLKVDELERRVAEQADEISSLQVHAHAQDAVDELAALRKRMSKAKNTVEWLMKGGEPCRLSVQIRPAKWAMTVSLSGKRELSYDPERAIPTVLSQP